MNLYSSMKYLNAEGQRSKGAEEDEENSVSVLRYQGGGKLELPNLG